MRVSLPAVAVAYSVIKYDSAHKANKVYADVDNAAAKATIKPCSGVEITDWCGAIGPLTVSPSAILSLNIWWVQ